MPRVAVRMCDLERSSLMELHRRNTVALVAAVIDISTDHLAVFGNAPAVLIAATAALAAQRNDIIRRRRGLLARFGRHIARSSSATAKHSTKHGANVSKSRAGFNGQRCALSNIARCNNVNAISVRGKGGFLTINVYEHAIQLVSRIGHCHEFEIFIGGNRDLRGGQAHELIGAVGLLDRGIFQHKRNVIFSFRLGGSRLRRALVVYRGILFHGIFHSRSLFFAGSARRRCCCQIVSLRLGSSLLAGSRNRSSLVGSCQSHCGRIVCRLFLGLNLFRLRDFSLHLIGLRRFIARESLRRVHRRPTEAQQHYREHYRKGFVSERVAVCHTFSSCFFPHSFSHFRPPSTVLTFNRLPSWLEQRLCSTKKKNSS